MVPLYNLVRSLHKQKAQTKTRISSFISFIFQFDWKESERHLCISWNRNSIKTDWSRSYTETQLGQLPPAVCLRTTANNDIIGSTFQCSIFHNTPIISLVFLSGLLFAKNLLASLHDKASRNDSYYKACNMKSCWTPSDLGSFVLVGD